MRKTLLSSCIESELRNRQVGTPVDYISWLFVIAAFSFRIEIGFFSAFFT